MWAISPRFQVFYYKVEYFIAENIFSGHLFGGNPLKMWEGRQNKQLLLNGQLRDIFVCVYIYLKYWMKSEYMEWTFTVIWMLLARLCCLSGILTVTYSNKKIVDVAEIYNQTQVICLLLCIASHCNWRIKCLAPYINFFSLYCYRYV